METANQIRTHLLYELEMVKSGEGRVVGIVGEGGIGKSFILTEFLKCIEEDTCFVLKANGANIPKPALSYIYEAIFNSITLNKLRLEVFSELFKVYGKALPGVGKYVPEKFADTELEAATRIMQPTGLSIASSANPRIVKFIQKLSKRKQVVFIFDNLQWVDEESWNFISYLIDHISSINWLVVFSYNDRTSIWRDHHAQEECIRRWKSHANNEVSFHYPKRWNLQDISELCTSILGFECRLDNNQLSYLISFTSGIPLLVRLFLNDIRGTAFLSYEGGIFVGKGDWAEIKMSSASLIKDKIKKVYRDIEDSRKPLEIASVVGEQFRDDEIEEMTEADYQKLLFRIEKESSVIQYLFDEHLWSFEHSLVHKVIYESIGKSRPKLHNIVARYLAGQDDTNFLTTAYHFAEGKDFDNALRYRAKEAERLLEASMFQAALSEIKRAFAELPNVNRKLLEKETLLYAKTILGQCLFQAEEFGEALEEFKEIKEKFPSTEIEASCNRWIGRSYLKLASQDDFRKGTDFLEQAIVAFQELDDADSLGQSYADLVVAHAHQNRLAEAEAAYHNAEKCFERARSPLSLAKLHRRCVIFMDNQLSSQILLRVSKMFRDIGVLHEVIMSLNNAATVFLYLDQLDKSKSILTEALIESRRIDYYGLGSLFNNLALIFIVQGNLTRAKKYLSLALSSEKRVASRFVIDLNFSVVHLLENGASESLRIFDNILSQAESIGENVYIRPAKINFSYCLSLLAEYERSIEILNTIVPAREDDSYSKYEKFRWYKLMRHCLNRSNPGLLKEFDAQHGWDPTTEYGVFHSTDFALIDMQFWSG